MNKIDCGASFRQVPTFGVGGESLEGVKMGVRPRRPGLA